MLNKEFYRHCYRETGWLPMRPLTQALALGDVCQIRNGCFRQLLNIGDAHLVEKLHVSHEVPLNGAGWQLHRGARQSFCETIRKQGDDESKFFYTRQLLEFPHADDFIFHARKPKAHLLLNWNHIRHDLTLKLTQLHYSFRHAYVITAVAEAHEWGLAVAGQDEAKLEMTVEAGESDRYLLMSHEGATADRCTGIASYETARGRPAYFFKAKKLAISDAMFDHYLNQLLQNKADLGEREIANWLEADLLNQTSASLLNQVKINEFNINTSIGFFTWVDMSLDDVEMLGG